MVKAYDYVIVGGGLAGAWAIQGIRELDVAGNILLICEENYLPYDRPPLSKKLWFGKQKVEDIFLHDHAFYEEQSVSLAVGARVGRLEPSTRTVNTFNEHTYEYGKLLLATGCKARRLAVPGGDLDGICYFRGLDDYMYVCSRVAEGKSALIVGGGFIGSELAAALNINKLEVTMIFPGETLCSRVFPDYLGRAMQQRYRDRGVRIMTADQPVSFSKSGSKVITRTAKGTTIETDIVIVGVGVLPDVALAENGGLKVLNGIAVNEYLETSRPDIFAAGDNAFFPYHALDLQMRIEHWDNALNQGRQAGRNMAGAHEPYFFSDLFEFGYEATGEVDARLETFADWQKEYDTGVIYYLRDGRVRGVMMCNMWDRLEAARELIRNGEVMTLQKLRGLIR